ncbi:cathepsin 7-like [Trifolium medium]|uniref:Cathepsin 7-like n=1 Tax=Trifolium medium TaxID=97028 RepID=A0A392P5Q3_9FABA|nr:cathepsin 7-like [Trifolium medium]
MYAECCYAHAAVGGVEYLHHRKQRGQNRVILSPQDIYNNLVYGQNEVEEDAQEDEDVDKHAKSTGHSVLVMGFGPDYWLVHNSHGDDWGNAGYAKFTRAMVHGRFLIDGCWAPVGIAYQDPDGEPYNAI